MEKFSAHNKKLVNFFESVIGSSNKSEARQYIDLDKADYVLRSLLTIDEMREIGSFFTGQKLATNAVSCFVTPISDNSIVLDPSCGTGNLLIEASRRLSAEKSLSATLSLWGTALRGFDIHSAFVETTKIRLALEAINRGAELDCSLDEALIYLHKIKVFDAMDADESELVDVTHALMNPPFSSWDSGKTDFWNSGKVNAAAIILSHYAKYLPKDCELSAVLPDVLRSGSRYEKWRNFIGVKFAGSISVQGQFNPKTDIDVFLLSGKKIENASNKLKWFNETLSKNVLADKFNVCVGPLVAYRDKLEGPNALFIHPRNIRAWENNNSIAERRRFKGKLISPPFVAIKRTSSPSDKQRICAALISGSEPVAVENHLIVAVPKNGEISECENLLSSLQCNNVEEFVNNRIRCRHLTVAVIKEIPYLNHE